ncbi:MAG: hypothetical protein VSS75_020550 [Candidatus Parabeggiatoa sp.]|nr:hypothetical protein [Candidatus Parabeggiatoa sp.]
MYNPVTTQPQSLSPTQAFKPATLAMCVLTALNVSTPQSATAAEPAIRAEGSFSLGLRDDGVLFQIGGNTNTLTIPVEFSLSDRAVFDGVESIPLSSNTAPPVIKNSSEVFDWCAQQWCPQGMSNSPTQVSNFADVKEVVGGDYNGRYLAVTNTGQVFSTKRQTDGSYTPANEVRNLSAVQSLDMTYDKYFAVTNTGDVYWGKWDWGINTPEPATQLTGLSGVESFEIVDGYQRYMAVTNTGNVYSGRWDSGSSAYTTASVSGLPSIKEVDMTYQRYLAVADSGAVYSGKWQDGNSNTPMSAIPVSSLADVKTIEMAYSNSIALTNGGQVYTVDWEYSSNTPTSVNQITPLSNIIAISTSDSHSLALQADGILCGWGNNDRGQLGSGNPNPVPVHSPVCGLEDLIISETTTCSGDDFAVYSTTDRKVTFDKVAMELYNPWDDQPNGKFALFTGAGGVALTLEALIGFGDFKLSRNFELEYAGEVIETPENCYPSYSEENESLNFGVKIPWVTVLPNGKVIEGPLECYSVNMKQSKTQPDIFRLTTADPIDCE